MNNNPNPMNPAQPNQQPVQPNNPYGQPQYQQQQPYQQNPYQQPQFQSQPAYQQPMQDPNNPPLFRPTQATQYNPQYAPQPQPVTVPVTFQRTGRRAPVASIVMSIIAAIGGLAAYLFMRPISVALLMFGAKITNNYYDTLEIYAAFTGNMKTAIYVGLGVGILYLVAMICCYSHSIRYKTGIATLAAGTAIGAICAVLPFFLAKWGALMSAGVIGGFLMAGAIIPIITTIIGIILIIRAGKGIGYGGISGVTASWLFGLICSIAMVGLFGYLVFRIDSAFGLLYGF